MMINPHQKLLFGPGSLVELANEIRDFSSLFVVHGNQSYIPVSDQVEKQLDHVTLTHFTGFSANPKLDDVVSGIEILRCSNAQAIIAIGGGSTIDMAKLIKAFADEPGALDHQIISGQVVTPRDIPLIVLPTTAGSGSEATHFAVCYIDGIKHSVAHPDLRPNIAIVDPQLSSQMPPELTATTGLDALCQAIESFWAIGATNQSIAYAREAITIVWAGLRDAVNHPTTALRERMAYAAYLAGCAIDISKTTAPHALSYALTIQHNIPHGHAVALTLASLFTISADNLSLDTATDPRGIGHTQSQFTALCLLLDCKTPEDLPALWQTLLTDLGLINSINELQLTDAEKLRIVDSVNLERLGNHPVKLSRQQLNASL